MKTNRRLLAVLLILVMAIGLWGCGASSPAAEESRPYDGNMAADAPAEAPMPEAVPNGLASEEGLSGLSAQPRMNTEKIIYSADVTLETTDYEETVQGIYELTEELGGFMESTSMSGANYYQSARGFDGDRSAQFVIRVPCENFDTLTASLSALGNVPYCSTFSENITRTYYDVQSRLTAFETQEARLLEMLAVAESVEDMLAIQQQLTEVQYEIDSLTGTLENYDHQVSFSTVSLTVQEVQEYTPEPAQKMTYWQRMGHRFTQSLRDVGHFFTELLLWLVGSLPVLLLLAAVLAVVLWLLRRFLRRGRRFRRKDEKDDGSKS